MALHEGSESEGALAAETAGDLGIADAMGGPVVGALQEGEVVVGAVEPDLGLVEEGEELGNIRQREGIDEGEVAIDSELDEAELFRVVMEGIGLGIDEGAEDAAALDGAADFVDEGAERGFIGNPAAIGGRDGGRDGGLGRSGRMGVLLRGCGVAVGAVGGLGSFS
jgi:hypothetical protein